MISQVGILTSCCIPNSAYKISKIDKAVRASDLIDNVEYLASKRLFSHLIIVDPSLVSDEVLHESIKSKIHAINASNHQTKFWLVSATLTPAQIEQVSIRGKGYSELQILNSGLTFITNMGIEYTSIVKLSGRYKVINMVSLAPWFNQQIAQGADICCEINHLKSKVNTVLFAFSSNAVPAIIECESKINDTRGMFIERVFYDKFVLNSLIKCKRSFPSIYDPSVRSGSVNLRYSYFQQLPRLISAFI